MPRLDKTFSDSDLLRFYCRNLDPSEKYLVMEAFKNHIKKGIKICPNDPDKNFDPCAWIAFTKKLTDQCAEKSKLLAQIAIVLTTLEVALSSLIWIGLYGKILKIIVLIIGYVVSVLIFCSALLSMIGSLGVFINGMNKFFCTGEDPGPLEKPPELNLPEDPSRRMDEIVNWIESIFFFFFPSDTDNLPPELLPGP